MKWDAFISHASEDNEYARNLAEELQKKGIRVWYDEFELRVGSSLRRSIDHGLSNSRFGIVILSPAFFAKEWTKKELGALTARETTRKNIVLPIRHTISLKVIREYSPILADTYQIDSGLGVDKTVENLLLVLKPKVSKSQKETPVSNEEIQSIQSELEVTRNALDAKKAELHAVLAQADELIHTDPLTMLPNRRWMGADVQRQMTYSARYGAPLFVAMLQLDQFSEIRDAHGLDAGDQVLRFVASELRDRIRQPDEIGLYNVDIFLLILPNTSSAAAMEQMERCRRQIESVPIVYAKQVFRVTLSIGGAPYRPDKEDWKQLIDRVEKLLYVSKAAGGNRYTVAE